MTPDSVLVVEDDEDLRELVRQALEREISHVRTAVDGEAALADIEAHGLPAVILLDMRMRGMGGAELAHELHRRGLTPPIIVMTAAGNARTRAEEIGAAGWLAKPFSIEDLLSTVRRFVHRPSSSAAPT